ncbi:MAG UNVERIFIED_CONTAM: hypothetical protein LVT10_00385 [Anaerolineae bacterium]
MGACWVSLLNPSIFQQAIGESTDYDGVIQANLDLDAVELYEKLAVRDIQDAGGPVARCVSIAPKHKTDTLA